MQVLRPSQGTGVPLAVVVPRATVDPVDEVQGVPFRTLTVASALYNAGHEILFFDQETDYDRVDRSEELRDGLRGVFAAFIWMNELYPAIQLSNCVAIARIVKSWYPEMPVIVGGSTLNLFPADYFYIEDWPIDYFLRGYGEVGAVRLVDALAGEEDWELVPGLIWPRQRRHNPDQKIEPLRPEHLSLYRELDLSPFIQHHGGVFGNGQGTLILGTARGCAKHCEFCYWTNYRLSMLDGETIVDLVSFLRERYGVRQYHLAELDFFANRKRPLEMARHWRERVPDCTWFTLASPVDALRYSRDDWELLAAGGCRKLELGTETGSGPMLSAIGKRHGPEDPYEVTRRALEHGIRVMHNFIFGFVGETEADRQASLELIRSLHELDPERVFFSFRFFQPVLGVPMARDAFASDPGELPQRIDQVISEYRPILGRESTRTFHWLSPEDELRVKRLVNYFLPMTTSRLDYSGRLRRWSYRGLRFLARLRLSRGAFRLDLDRWIYERWLKRTLAQTYRA